MANTIYSQGDKVEYGIKIYYVDTEADKTNLPKRSAKMGSKCYVIEDKKWYILNGSYEWVPFVDAGGSGGSGSPFVPKGSVATVDELPTEDNTIGDLYIVQADHSEWVWLTSTEEPNGYWEQIGSAILPSDIIEVTGQMTDAQAAETRGNLGAEPEKFVVNIEVVWGSSENTVTSDKTFSEIYAAYDSGKMICVIAGGVETKTLVVSDSMCAFMDILPLLNDGKCYYHLFMVDDQDNWTAYEQEIALTPSVITSIQTSATIRPKNNKIYRFINPLTSLEIVIAPEDDSASYSIVFTSGTTATTTTIPSTILGLESFAAEANTIYEINVLDNRAVVGSWAVSV